MTEQTDRELISERIDASYARIAEIAGERVVPEPFGTFFRKTAGFLLLVKKDADNRALYEDILPENYAHSYGNPDYAAEALGADYGPYFSAVYAELRAIIPAVFEGDDEDRAILYELFVELYSAFEVAQNAGDELPSAKSVKYIFSSWLRDYTPFFVRKTLREQLDPEFSYFTDMVMNADFSSAEYLYKCGEYITEETLRTAAYVNSLPEEEIARMAETFSEGFRRGFVNAKKDLSAKRTVRLIYVLGFERLMRKMIENFREMGLRPLIMRDQAHLLVKPSARRTGVTGALPNMQFDYDHREDLALIMDEQYASVRKRVQKETFEEFRDEAGWYAGPAYLEVFGEAPFEPKACRAALHLTDEQNQISLSLRSDLMRIQQRYIPSEKRSFSIMALPVADIGEQFEDIFKDTIAVNTLDNDEYTRIQQNLIDALDEGTRVHVKGAAGNRTDLMVALHPLKDPDRETIFENCVADVNIPVGEVFTSPVLKGTNGTLHVSHVFLNGYEFRDLEILFKDGMIARADCGNFENEAENQAFIRENILFRHPTLTLGEFAIGTNTTAYVMSERYGIGALMPILIAEKTGPHFAVGDTCYSYEEDFRVYNPDGKEIVARENEHSALRKTEPEKAYYGCHTDITLPYEELGSITVLRADGSGIPLLKDGRFVLPGTEELNKPLMK